VFRPYRGEKMDLPKSVEREALLESIHQAQFKPIPNGFKKLESADLQRARQTPGDCDWMARQEPGVRPACPLPYELSVDGAVALDRKSFAITFAAQREIFAERAAGAPFLVYDYANAAQAKPAGVRSYAVAAGDRLSDAWALRESAYHLRVHGPNGFYREFRGTADDPAVEVTLKPARSNGTLTGGVVLRLINRDAQRPYTIHLEGVSYGSKFRDTQLGAAGTKTGQAEIVIGPGDNHGWHDLRVTIAEAPQFEKRYAGRVETGRESITDPVMGRPQV
jgi:phospholipase C